MAWRRDKNAMRLGWATDIHLDHASPAAWKAFADQVNGADLDQLVITGDISNATRLRADLKQLREFIPWPVYIHVLLGNHDYYGSGFQEIDRYRDTWACEAYMNSLHNALCTLYTEDNVCLVGLNG